jgi:uncharacterized protein (DUF2062 family)
MFLRRKKVPLGRRIRHILSPKRGYKRAIKRTFKYIVWRLKRLPGTPEFIARGFAIGIAVNFWPVLFTHLIFGYMFCMLLDGSLLAMFIGTLAGNPWTFAIVYPLMYKIGKVLLGLKPIHAERSIDAAAGVWDKIWPIESWHSLSMAFQHVLWPMIIGGFLLGLPFTLLAYYLGRNAIKVYQMQHRRNLLKKFEKVEQEIQAVHTEKP